MKEITTANIATIPARIKAGLKSKTIANRLAIIGPANEAAEKNTHIFLAAEGSVFSVIIFISGPRTIESPKPKMANRIISTNATVAKGKNITDEPAANIPANIIFFGAKISPRNPFRSCPAA